MGVLRGRPEDLLARDAQALFFPHGLGHMLGLGVRDATGFLPGRRRSKRPGLRYLRVDLPLDKGFVMTVEPGIYFIPALLNNAANREQHRDTVAWERVDRMLDFGGIRIEDNVLVTDAAPEVLTAAIPVG
jgi:Xaa-Pro aminopeptidase